MEIFPLDILHVIFQSLTYTALLRSRLVCKKWHRAVSTFRHIFVCIETSGRFCRGLYHSCDHHMACGYLIKLISIRQTKLKRIAEDKSIELNMHSMEMHRAIAAIKALKHESVNRRMVKKTQDELVHRKKQFKIWIKHHNEHLNLYEAVKRDLARIKRDQKYISHVLSQEV